MADWTDGPEYAPAVRPELFEPPAGTTLVLTAPTDAPSDAVRTDEPIPTEDAPQPTYRPPDTVPLDRLAARTTDPRDPTDPFDVGGFSETPLGISGPTHDPHTPFGDERVALAPRAPLPQVGVPPAGTPQAWPAPTSAPVAPPPDAQQREPATLSTITKQASWSLIGWLLMGGLLGEFSPVCLIIAIYTGRRSKPFTAALGVSTAIAAVWTFFSSIRMYGWNGFNDTVSLWWSGFSTTTTVISWLALALTVVLIITGRFGKES